MAIRSGTELIDTKEATRHRTPVMALVWLDDDYLVSGAEDGSLRFTGPRLRFPLAYHAGLAVRAMW